MHLYPTKHQGGEMLQCAKEVAERPSGRHLSYPEFCTYPARELRRSNDRSHPRQIGKIQDKNGQEKKKKSRKMSKSSNVTHDVFLGGSCNPTTWRRDVAIPLLDEYGVSYYNPQVAEWSAELVAVEHRAKASAKILFYVLDNQTRNVVGIVEAANFAGSRRNVVAVIDHYQPGQRVAGEPISNREFEELCGGLATLQDLLERQGIPIFTSIPIAVSCMAKLLHVKQNDRNKVRNSKYNHVHQLGDKMLREVFDTLDPAGSGEISLTHFCMAYGLLTNRKLSISDLNGMLGERKDNKDCIRINFDQFQKMVSDLKIQNGMIEKWAACCAKVAATNPLQQHAINIYVGGSCFDYTWKQEIAAPILENSGLKFRFADCTSQSSSRASLTEMEAMYNSSVLLFVITSNTRGLETMALASYFIGLGRHVILCIQQLSEGCTIENEKLSEIARNDYNRGRFYLADEARRRGLPVFQNVAEAVQCAVDKCLNNSTPAGRR